MHEEPHEPQPVLHPALATEASDVVDVTERTPEVSSAVETSEPARKPRVIALLNQKGGVGKTTSTVNLGAAFARYGQRVLLVDLDPQSNLSLHFGVESGHEFHRRKHYGDGAKVLLADFGEGCASGAAFDLGHVRLAPVQHEEV